MLLGLSSLPQPWEKNGVMTDPDRYAAQVWPHLEAAADNLNLQLVSPTTRQGTGPGEEAWWMASFLAAVDSGDATTLDKIKVFDLHAYHCGAWYWQEGDGSVEWFYRDVVEELLQKTNSKTRCAHNMSCANLNPQPT